MIGFFIDKKFAIKGSSTKKIGLFICAMKGSSTKKTWFLCKTGFLC
jgi:hypothetical protein